MRLLVISDIHANLTALDAVLNDAGPVQGVWCLGDLVGYGPDPNECIARVRGLPNLVCILGNHDAAALGEIDVEAFNTEARLSIQWLVNALSVESIAFLTDLPEKVTVGQVTLAHGSPRNPVWEYIIDTRSAQINFHHFDTDYCFVGHTHIPVIFSNQEGVVSANLLTPETAAPLQLAPRAILNPGSVGQPRDHVPTAAYAIFNPEALTWECRRVPYNIGEVQKRIIDAGLPTRHAMRLSEGW